ncbi:unnamed protein product [Nesidiocoris tenuis]|uniref:GRIP domain-containing protein n=1 Tax=Nesidiocoris tenuis TaxID=355587 RepID=A0A6H5H7P3_9HEMI|nr:unnamed protein product [Nesidiocoris tenuis]
MKQCLSTNAVRGRSPRLEDDNESLRSGISCCSSASQCDHAHFARNGTTFSGRTKKFIVHCSPTHGEPDRYMTPTQRASSTIRRLQSQLSISQAEIQEKEYEIARLTRELVELRLGKAEAADSPVHKPLHFSNGHSSHNGGGYYELRPQYDDLKKKLEEVQKEKDELKTKFTESEDRHRQTYLQMFNKGQEAALFEVDQGTSDGPAKAATLPQLLKELEVTKAELDSVRDLDFWNTQRSLSGNEAVSIWNLCRKTMYRRLLESRRTKSEQDAEVTLQFLKSAVYYFLTDRENATGHLAAIQSILGFSGDEKSAIEKASHSWK